MLLTEKKRKKQQQKTNKAHTTDYTSLNQGARSEMTICSCLYGRM